MPVTTVFGGLLGRAGRWLYHRTASNSHAALARLGLAERIALTPEGIPAERACIAIDIAIDLCLPVLNFSFHSPSLQPGRNRWSRWAGAPSPGSPAPRRSEEHTSELQSLMRISYAVFCLKKKIKYTVPKLIHTSTPIIKY